MLTVNRPPTVVIASGPEGTLDQDSARFSWLGADRDGNLAGYYVALDDSTPDLFVDSTAVTWRALGFGPHTFFVQAVDDSGARSATAARSFDCQYRGGVRARGTDTTFELTTWNIENFPKAGTATLAALRSIIPRLDIDLFAVQEIADTIAFRDLVASLAGYEGIYSADDYGNFYQKTGVIYRRDLVTVGGVRQLFWHNDSVTRPPLSIQVATSVNGQVFDFELIVVHLKAGGSDADRAERRATCRLLKGYIDALLQGGGDPDIVVAGDWNDNLNDPPSQNSFQVFLDDTVNYRFLTAPLVGNSRQSSYIGGSLIDHVMVTRDALGEYGTGWTETLRLDDEVAGYVDEVSDHRPVMAAFALPGARRPAR
ncbi:MAG: endonuclease/exonuclease/phosphatase family protein [bacterium]